MESAATTALTRLASKRFHSFSEAIEATLDALGEAVPGTVFVGQLDSDDICQVIGASSNGLPGLERGATLPMRPANGGGPSEPSPDGSYEIPDPAHLQALGLMGSISVPLEMSHGNVVGTLCAVDSRSDAFDDEHGALLAIAGSLLSYEWESVQQRAELRRLQARARDTASADPETGLPNRERFLQLLDREWRLAERGSVQSALVACRIEPEGLPDAAAAAMGGVLLRDAAEVIEATVRSTDHVGRVGVQHLVAILVGTEVGRANHFIDRYRSALDRVTSNRPVGIELRSNIVSLAEGDSAEAALEAALAGLEGDARVADTPAGPGAAP